MSCIHIRHIRPAGELFIEMAAHAGQGLFGYEQWIEEIRRDAF